MVGTPTPRREGETMKLWVALEGRDEEVEFRAEGDRLWLDVAGQRLEADFHRLPDGEVYSLLVDGRSFEVRVVHTGNGIEVTRHGVTVPVEVRHPLEKLLQTTQRAATGRGGEVITAPMPGLVVAIRVKPGERVAPGQPVAVVEAMKMQNELVARRGGVVSEVLVAERATVGAGQALLKLAPEGP
jgi:biotin carboxyl carrier protein